MASPLRSASNARSLALSRALNKGLSGLAARDYLTNPFREKPVKAQSKMSKKLQARIRSYESNPKLKNNPAFRCPGSNK